MLRHFKTGVCLGAFSLCFLFHCSAELNTAKMAYNQKDYQKTIAYCLKELESRPDNSDIYFLLGRAYGKTNQPVKMVDAFRLSMQYSKKHKEMITQYILYASKENYTRSLEYIRYNRFHDAIKKLHDVIMLNPVLLEAYHTLAETYLHLGNKNDAIKVYQDGLIIVPHDPDFKIELGWLYLEKKRYHEVINLHTSHNDSSMVMNDLERDRLYQLTTAYIKTDKKEAAIAVYANALTHFPEDILLHYNSGCIHAALFQYTEAVKQFRKVLTVNPNDFQSNLRIGISLLALHENQILKHVTYLYTSILHPFLPFNSSILHKSEFLNQAIHALKKATQLRPGNHEARRYLSRAMAQISQGKTS